MATVSHVDKEKLFIPRTNSPFGKKKQNFGLAQIVNMSASDGATGSKQVRLSNNHNSKDLNGTAGLAGEGDAANARDKIALITGITGQVCVCVNECVYWLHTWTLIHDKQIKK